MQVLSVTRRLAGYAIVPALAVCLVIPSACAQGRDDHRDDHHQSGHNNQPPDFHFQDQHRNNFQSHYSKDINHWKGQGNRPHFERGQQVPVNYRFQPVPTSYYRGAPPPPPGYRYGYSDGYVVAYNPTTRIIADVLDLVAGH